MKKIPSYLEYFLEDILWLNNEFQAKIDESILENKEELEKYIESSLDY